MESASLRSEPESTGSFLTGLIGVSSAGQSGSHYQGQGCPPHPREGAVHFASAKQETCLGSWQVVSSPLELRREGDLGWHMPVSWRREW